MKVIITESRRDRLAKQELDKNFSNMYEDVDYVIDSMGERKTISYRNGDGVIMVYNDAATVLYICDDVTKPLEFFSYTPQQLKDLIGEWFSDKFELPVKLVHHVKKGLLN
jgi:hypothetical protein